MKRQAPHRAACPGLDEAPLRELGSYAPVEGPPHPDREETHRGRVNVDRARCPHRVVRMGPRKRGRSAHGHPSASDPSGTRSGASSWAQKVAWSSDPLILLPREGGRRSAASSALQLDEDFKEGLLARVYGPLGAALGDERHRASRRQGHCEDVRVVALGRDPRDLIAL